MFTIEYIKKRRKGRALNQWISPAKVRRDRGSIVVLLAISSIALFGFLGLVVDGGLIYLTHQRMTKACDAASLAAAIEMPVVSKATEEALQYAALNGFVEGDDTTITIGRRPTSANPNWVFVSMTKRVPLYFMRILGYEYWDLSAESAAVYYSYLPMSITGTGVYGTTGIQYLCIFGENGRKSYGDPYSPKWEMDGTPNLEYNPEGYNFLIKVPDDYYAINGTNNLAIEIYDADCWNANGQTSPSATGVDEIHLASSGYPTGHPPVGSGYTTTNFTVYAPDDTPNNYDDDVLVATWTWKEGDSTADTDMQWYAPPGFTFDTSAYGMGNYRINVTSGDGTANNVYHLRSGPPLVTNGGELSNPAPLVIEGTYTMTLTPYNWDANTVTITINGVGYSNSSAEMNIVHTSNNYGSPVTVDITSMVNQENCTIAFTKSGGTRKIKNLIIQKDGVTLSGYPKFTSGSSLNINSQDFTASGTGGMPSYTLEFTAYSWDVAAETQIFFNSTNLDWSSQGLSASNGTKTYSIDVTNFIGGDNGSVSVLDNTNTNTNWFSNMVLKKDGVTLQDFTGGTQVEPTATPTTFQYSGLGSDAGWGEGSQFDPFNGTSMSGISSLEMEFVMNGTVNVCLGEVPPEAAGVALHIQKFDTDVGAKSVTYWDTLGNSWNGTLSGNGTWMEDQIVMPDNYAGGTMYATYQAGSGDTSTWYMWFENSMAGMPGKVRLVK